MKIHIFLLCYNEEIMMPLTINHYKTRLPSALLTIFDNYSTDRSYEIAKAHGCGWAQYESDGYQHERQMMWVRNNLWKRHVTQEDTWIIMCDMDEWLDITEEELEREDKKGTTILTTQGFNIVGDSTTEDLSDIELSAMKKGVYCMDMSKRICFKYPNVKEINFWWGSHTCQPEGTIVYSEKKYVLKHYDLLGLAYCIRKNLNRYERNEECRKYGFNGHYLNDLEQIKERYLSKVAESVELP
jgi:hypothetical protein